MIVSFNLTITSSEQPVKMTTLNSWKNSFGFSITGSESQLISTIGFNFCALAKQALAL